MKKSLYALCCLAALFAFSCATTPEGQNNQEIDSQIPLETENPAEENLPEQGTEVQEAIEEPLPEEKIEEESLPEIEEVEEEKTDEEEEILPIEEEIVLDAPVEEAEPEVETEKTDENAENQDAETDSDNTADERSDSDETENTSENENDGVNTEENISSETENSENPESFENVEAENENQEESEDEDDSEEEIKIVPSRTMTVDKNQLIDITYPGKGWIYQGCIDEEGNVDVRNRYFVFGGRKLGGEDTLFTLRSRLPGTFLLHFYKNDALSGSYIDDYLEVSVTDKSSQNQNHVAAPSYSEIVPPKATITSDLLKQKKQIEEDRKRYIEEEKEEKTENKASSVSKIEAEEKTSTKNNDSELKTVIQKNDGEKNTASDVSVKTETKPQGKESKSASVEISKTPQQILKEAQAAYDSKNYAESLRLIDIYLEIAVNKIDEGLFLKALTLEARSKVQNIKEAVKLYDLLIQTYPQSKLWDKANERSIYLKRMYINIR